MKSDLDSLHLIQLFFHCFTQVLLVAAGLEHSLVVVAANQEIESYIFAFGENAYGQLGNEVYPIKNCV